METGSVAGLHAQRLCIVCQISVYLQVRLFASAFGVVCSNNVRVGSFLSNEDALLGSYSLNVCHTSLQILI